MDDYAQNVVANVTGKSFVEDSKKAIRDANELEIRRKSDIAKAIEADKRATAERAAVFGHSKGVEQGGLAAMQTLASQFDIRPKYIPEANTNSLAQMAAPRGQEFRDEVDYLRTLDMSNQQNKEGIYK